MKIKKALLILVSLFLYLCSRNIAIADSASLIIYETQTKSKSNSGSSGSSRSKNTIVERLIRTSSDGLELEYSFLDGDVPANDAWKFPARVFNKPGISIELINEPEIKTRLELYLDEHPKIRERCGGVVFTWTAFEIHCDTSHVTDLIEGFNLHLGTLSEGKLFEEPGVLAPVKLKKLSSDGAFKILVAEFELDPALLQSQNKKEMEQVAAITGQSVDSIMNSVFGLSNGEIPEFSGNKIVTIELRANGEVAQIKRETTTTIRGGGSFHETRMQTETLKRQPAN